MVLFSYSDPGDEGEGGGGVEFERIVGGVDYDVCMIFYQVKFSVECSASDSSID